MYLQYYGLHKTVYEGFKKCKGAFQPPPHSRKVRHFDREKNSPTGDGKGVFASNRVKNGTKRAKNGPDISKNLPKCDPQVCDTGTQFAKIAIRYEPIAIKVMWYMNLQKLSNTTTCKM